MSHSSHPSAPQRSSVIAGRYRLDDLRAQGGMADVWQATDLQLTRVVAVKLLKPHLVAESTLAERFRREAIAAANLNHENIVTVYDAIEDQGRQAVIMEYVDGESLRERLNREKTLTVSAVLTMGYSVCSALNAAHKQGLIHRDVKPGNILISNTKKVKLTDFGIAKLLDSDEDLTTENVMMGTAKYLSPEQVKGDDLDARADLYSLGLVMYECLAGKVPFVGKNDTETALARLQRDATDITTLRPDIESGVGAVIHKLMAREPKHRYATAGHAGAAIRTLIEGMKSPTPTTASRPTSDRTPTTGKVIRPKNHTPTSIARAEPKIQPPTKKVPPTKTSWKPSLAALVGIVAGLLVAGIIVAQLTKSNTEAELLDVITTNNAPVIDSTDPVSITGIRSFDPQGDDGSENEKEAANATDGNAETSWSTSCYKSSTFGSKSGVGLVFRLNSSVQAQMQADVVGTGWRARIYTSNNDGDTLDAWGSSLWEGSSDDGPTITTTFTTPSQFALIYFTKIGQSGFCSNNNPYRGYISEVRITAAP